MATFRATLGKIGLLFILPNIWSRCRYLLFAFLLLRLANDSRPLFLGAVRLCPRVKFALEQAGLVAKAFL